MLLPLVQQYEKKKVNIWASWENDSSGHPEGHDQGPDP